MDVVDVVDGWWMVVFAGMSVGDREAEWVGMVLEKNTTITTIGLECVVDVVCGGWWMDMGCGVFVCVCVWWMGQDGMDNQIGDGGAEHIARALEKNTTITYLDLNRVWWVQLTTCGLLARCLNLARLVLS